MQISWNLATIIDTDVANGHASTANAAAPAGFAGFWISFGDSIHNYRFGSCLGPGLCRRKRTSAADGLLVE